MTKAGAQRLAAELGLALVAPDTSPRGDANVPGARPNWDFGVGAGFYLDATEAPWASALPHGELPDRRAAAAAGRAPSPIDTERARPLRPFDGRPRRADAGAAASGTLPLALGLRADLRADATARGAKRPSAATSATTAALGRARCERADARTDGRALPWRHPGRPGPGRQIPAPSSCTPSCSKRPAPAVGQPLDAAPPCGLRPRLLLRAELRGRPPRAPCASAGSGGMSERDDAPAAPRGSRSRPGRKRSHARGDRAARRLRGPGPARHRGGRRRRIRRRQALAALGALRVVGFDTESKPTFLKNEVSERAARGAVRRARPRLGVPAARPRLPRRRRRTCSPRSALTKVGFGLAGDRTQIRHTLGIEPQAVVDLDTVFRRRGYRNSVGVKGAVAMVFGQRFRSRASRRPRTGPPAPVRGPGLLRRQRCLRGAARERGAGAGRAVADAVAAVGLRTELLHSSND